LNCGKDSELYTSSTLDLKHRKGFADISEVLPASIISVIALMMAAATR
jgi:hypothetical protein